TGVHPTVESTGARRPVHDTGAYPATDTGAQPAVERTGARRAVEGTGAQASAAPAVVRTGAAPGPAATEVTGPQPPIVAEPAEQREWAAADALARAEARAGRPAWTAYLNDAPTGPMPAIQDETFTHPLGTVTAPVEVVAAPPAPPPAGAPAVEDLTPAPAP